MIPAFGAIEAAIVALGVLFGALDVADNPKAPSGAVVTSYAPEHADYVFYLDVHAVLPQVKRALDALRSNETLKSNPDVHAFVEEALASLDAGAGEIKKQIGVDLITDLNWAAAWVALPKDRIGMPRFLVVAAGVFPADVVDRIGRAMGAVVPTRDGRPYLEVGAYSLGTADDGALLFGDTALVDARIGPRGTDGKRPPSALTVRVTPLFADRPFVLLGSAPGPSLRELIVATVGSSVPFVADLLSGHEFLGLAIHRRGLRWTWVAPELAGVAAAKMASEGILELLRAGQLGTRGLVRLVLVSLRSYGGEEIAAGIVAHTDKLLKLIVDNTGDGRFEAKIDVRPKDRTVDVRATAASFKQVLPLGAVLPLIGAGFWMRARPEPTPVEQLREAPLAPATDDAL
jgi:hypothetical protein